MKFEPTNIGASTPAPLGSRVRRLTGALTALAGVALAVAPGMASAQRTNPTPVTTIDSVMADGMVKQVPIKTGKGFDLFAAEDLAAGSLRMTGLFRGGVTNQGGPVSENQGNNFIAMGQGNGAYLYFEMGFVAGTPPSEFRKIRNVHPGINNMAGSLGYNFHSWQVLVPPQIKRIGSADGQFGKVFSGATAIFNSSCRDDPRYLIQGFSLLPQKDCPDTWGSLGFQGKLVIPDSTWLSRFNADKANFRWDDWRIPKTALDVTNFLGTQSMYGFMSDYYREQKLRYGSVVPGGSGAPLDMGYPLGLEIRVDAWQMAAPATRNVEFYSATIVNKSADVYGTGIDYDSLYFGLGPGFLMNGQAPAAYWNFNNNTQYFSGGTLSGLCSATFPKRYTNASTAGCAGTGAGTTVHTITWLKSPLGDMRNKMFSNPASPYYNPTSPLADDTITFNHWKSNSFGQNSQNVGRSHRSGFGMLSSTEANYLDGRQPSDMTLANYSSLFQPEDWSGTYPPLEQAKFNKFVPGNQTNPNTGLPFGKWDYNNDGVQDTIFVPGCGRNGCAGVFSDSIAGGYRTSVGNILNTTTAGPFKLKANDTTQFLWALSFALDTLAIRQQVDNIITSYMTNYAGPQPFTFPAVVPGKTYSISSAELIDSLRAGQADANIGTQITIRYPQINPVDPYMVNLVNKTRQDSINGNPNTRRILRLNPGLLGRLSTRANDNLAAVVVFKSCDGGTSYTTLSNTVQGTCVAAPTRATDAGQQAFAWRPWATVNYTGGVPATGSTTENIMAGKGYLYSFVTRSRGFSDFKIVDSTSAGFIVTDVQTTLGFPNDTINSALATAGPSVIQMYAPITNVAGRSFARVDTATISGNATQSVIYGSVSNDVSGTTRLVYGNQFIVRKTVDTVTSATTTSVNVRYVIPSAATSAAGPAVTNFVARDQSFSVNANIPIRSGANVLSPGTLRGTVGSTRVYLDTLASPAAYPGYAWVTGDNKPIFVINDEYAANRERDQQNSPLYPGYTVVPRDSANATNGFLQELTPFGVLRDRNFVIRGPGDTLSTAGRNFVVQVQTINGKRTKGGRYKLTWQVDPFGPGAPFKLDPVADLQAAVTSSIVSATSKSTTISETSAAIAALVGATAARPLQRVRIPFSVEFQDTEGRTESLKFAMLARSSNTRLLGSGNDTVRVTVPDSIWLPGDTLVALQKVERDSSVGTGAARYVVVTADGANGFRPIPVLVSDSIGINRFLVSCNGGQTSSGTRPTADAMTCNPLVINSRGTLPLTAGGATGGWIPVNPGWLQLFELGKTFDNRSVVQLVATPFSTKTTISQSDLNRVNVVPNPYLARSDVDQLQGRTPTARIYFTGVPEQGILRIYSVSGQFLQELTWQKSDLLYTGNNAPTGDLPFNLRTREGLDMASGLYLFVLTATGTSGNGLTQSGKFVIIR